MFPSILQKSTLMALILFLFIGCNTNTEYALPDAKQVDALIVPMDSIKIEGDLGAFKLNRSIKEEVEGVYLLTLNFSADKPAELPTLNIKFAFSSVDIAGFALD